MSIWVYIDDGDSYYEHDEDNDDDNDDDYAGEEGQEVGRDLCC